MSLENVVAFPPVAIRPNWDRAVSQIDWTQAIDRLVFTQTEIDGDLTDFLSEAFQTEDIGQLERIASILHAIERHAQMTHHSVIERIERLHEQGA